VRVLASCGCDISDRPNYLDIQLQERRGRDYSFDGWSLQVNLDTGELMSFDRVCLTDRHCRQQGATIEPAQICTPDEMRQLVPRAIE
jgi:hypothetical protein